MRYETGAIEFTSTDNMRTTPMTEENDMAHATNIQCPDSGLMVILTYRAGRLTATMDDDLALEDGVSPCADAWQTTKNWCLDINNTHGLFRHIRTAEDVLIEKHGVERSDLDPWYWEAEPESESEIVRRDLDLARFEHERDL